MTAKNINRRDFIKALGTGTVVAGAASLAGCRSKLPNELDPAGHLRGFRHLRQRS